MQSLHRARNLTAEDLWSVDGIEEVSTTLKEEGDYVYYTIICRSFHLTSFAVLIDVYAITEV